MDLILGAYPIEPDDPGQRRRLFELLGASGLYGGLELPNYSTAESPGRKARDATGGPSSRRLPGR